MTSDPGILSRIGRLVDQKGGCTTVRVQDPDTARVRSEDTVEDYLQ